MVEKQVDVSIKCFCQMFPLADHVFQIVCMAMFAIWLGAASPRAKYVVAILPCVAFFSWIVFRCCRKKIISLMLAANEADDDWTAYMAERLSIRPMVVNFRKEHVEASEFAGIIGKSNAAGFAAHQYMHLVVAGYCKIIYRLTHAGICARAPHARARARAHYASAHAYAPTPPPTLRCPRPHTHSRAHAHALSLALAPH